MSIDKERREELLDEAEYCERLWGDEQDIRVSPSEIRVLLDLADERDRYRALLEETVDRVNDRLDAEDGIDGAGERFEVWIERIDAALEGKINE